METGAARRVGGRAPGRGGGGVASGWRREPASAARPRDPLAQPAPPGMEAGQLFRSLFT